jgi:hypothetical protein
MVLIAEEVRHRVDNRRQAIQQEQERKAAQEKEQRELSLLAEFDAVFRSYDFAKLTQLDLVPACIAENLSRSRIEEYALRQYRETKNAFALLFLCCQYNTDGTLQDCSFENLPLYFHGNIRANELQYEWINEVAGIQDIEQYPVFVNAICQQVTEHPELAEEAKRNHDALYFLLVENELLEPSSRKYMIFGGVVVAAIAVVTVVGILLSHSGIL